MSTVNSKIFARVYFHETSQLTLLNSRGMQVLCHSQTLDWPEVHQTLSCQLFSEKYIRRGVMKNSFFIDFQTISILETLQYVLL